MTLPSEPPFPLQLNPHAIPEAHPRRLLRPAALRTPLPHFGGQRGSSRRRRGAARTQRVIARRADQLAEELGFDRERVVSWGLAQAVLAAWWTFEDHGRGWDHWIARAELLSRLVTRAT